MLIKSCPLCGQTIESTNIICKKCKIKLDSEKLINFMTFCPICGYPRISDDYSCVWCNQKYDLKINCVSDYKMPYTQSIIRHFKFGKDKNLASIIAFYIKELIESIDTEKKAIIVPVPCSDASLKNRGWDHMKVIASMLERKVLPILEHSEDSNIQQKNLTKESRLKNSEKKYKIKSDYNGSRNTESIIIVDDIITTGSTIISAAKTLKDNGFTDVRAVSYLIEI